MFSRRGKNWGKNDPPAPAAKWRWLDDAWRSWLRRSPDGVDLFTRWKEAGALVDLLGEDVYRDQLVRLLSRVDPRDCAAAGFGCTRRLDRSCQGPQICSRDPSAEAAGAAGREGPVPGGCDTFYGWWDGSYPVRVAFSPGDRHRAVHWDRDLWIDGAAVAGDQTLDDYGSWLDERFFVIAAEGPDDHPAQSYVWDSLYSTIRSLVVHDADRGTTLILVPTPEERWTQPEAVRDGDRLLIHPDGPGGEPDRVLPIH
ncbi:hypothetical protein [Actinoplanes sp. NPDC023714]|uniref:hypothetical protein n=1 Tax=Actinoplanes sp. NPDC023714 TaxID=3154322 RepID=UPI0033D6CFEB